MKEVFGVFLRLGFVCFGGPTAHIAFFREEFVEKRKWLTQSDFSDLLTLCQFLPGPGSSQLGFSIGLKRAGVRGAMAAWCAFTLPSALIMIAFAYGLAAGEAWFGNGVIQGLKIAAAAVVAKALWGMFQTLCPGKQHIAIALASAMLVLLFPFSLMQILVILLFGGIGYLFLRDTVAGTTGKVSMAMPEESRLYLGIFLGLLLGLPLLAALFPWKGLTAFDFFFRTGSFVFGGGHVVLPLLKGTLLDKGWISEDLFMAGYGLAQAIPGPLFTISAYMGTAMNDFSLGVFGGLLCLVAIFLPSYFLLLGAMPLWDRFRENRSAKAALSGANAAVVGLLLAAYYNPIFVSSITGNTAFALALLVFGLLFFAGLTSWKIVLISGVLGYFLF